MSVIWTELSFGRHAGKTLPQVLFLNPSWFFWAMSAGVFCGRPSLELEADLLAARADSIRPRTYSGTPVLVEHQHDQFTGRFIGLEFVPLDLGVGGWRTEGIMLSAPYVLAPRDRHGGKMVVAAAKLNLFGDSSYRITRARADGFFADNDNFFATV